MAGRRQGDYRVQPDPRASARAGASSAQLVSAPPLQNPLPLLGDGWRSTALTLSLGEGARSMCRAVRLDDEGV
jgi:hypothetical protein